MYIINEILETRMRAILPQVEAALFLHSRHYWDGYFEVPFLFQFFINEIISTKIMI